MAGSEFALGKQNLSGRRPLDGSLADLFRRNPGGICQLETLFDGKSEKVGWIFMLLLILTAY
jgi:hypothetical protein